ncbi:MAG: AraC family transcriptional regulator [Oscillospiraceae bacterium]|nr:AraC family transcriptional regulator [Oscillospiraceae bacterium]
MNTQLPLYRISDELGFYDQFYFSRRFKEKYAVSPLKYRKMHQPVR